MHFKSLVIIPTYNEAENIAHIIPAIWKSVKDMHVLVVDDNSKDGTAQIVKDMLPKSGGRLHIMERSGKLGLGTAYIAGFKWALNNGYEWIIEMDADFSHDPAALVGMVGLLAKSPVVVGSRYIAGGGTMNWNFFRKCVSRFGGFYARMILGIKVRDLTGGFNGWHAQVLRDIGPDKVESEGYAFQIELKYRAIICGYEIVEMPIMFSERRAGQSKMSGHIIIEAMMRVWRMRLKVKHPAGAPKTT